MGELAFYANYLRVRGLAEVQPECPADVLHRRYDLSPVHSPGVGVTRIRLTAKGLDRVERVDMAGDQFRNALLINSIVNIGEGNQAAMNSPGAQQAAVATDDEAVEQLRGLIAEYRQALATEDPEPEVRRLADLDLEALEGQLERRPLSKPVVRELLSSLRALAEGMASNAAFAAQAAGLAS